MSEKFPQKCVRSKSSDEKYKLLSANFSCQVPLMTLAHIYDSPAQSVPVQVPIPFETEARKSLSIPPYHYFNHLTSIP